MKLFQEIDRLLSQTTMYRLVMYVLSVYAGASIIFSAINVSSLPLIPLLISFGVLLVFGFVANQFFAKLYNVPNNFESGIITTLILFCILPPATTVERAAAIGVVVIVAMASKYILARHNKHIFNPAAIAVVIIGLTGLLHATWWIGSPPMLPLTLLGGILILRKLRRFSMFAAFALVALVVMVLTAPASQDASTVFRNAFLSWPLIFLGTVMLTEPSTTPPSRYYQVLYGLLVGVLFASHLKFGPLHTTPEVALVIGNLFSYAVSSRYNLRLRLKEKLQLAPNVYEFVFKPDRKPSYVPGQYMEWTLSPKSVDGRGNRRTFTIASSPTEDDLRIGIKFYEPASTFKRHLLVLKPDQNIVAGHIGGDFTLPADASKKLVFIAGGIGITPFRSMIKYLIDTKQKRDILLFYAINGPTDAVYRELLQEAEKFGVKTYYLVNEKLPKGWNGYTGFLTDEILHTELADRTERVFYISGPPSMVKGYKKLLLHNKIGRTDIKTDYFSGY